MNFQQALVNSLIKCIASSSVFKGRFSTFEVTTRACETCEAPLAPDLLPLFLETGVYMTRRITCSSETCQGLKRNAIPTNGSPCLTRSGHRESSNDWERTLRRTDDCGHFPSSVELWCSYCKEETLVTVAGSGSRKTVVDGNPRWTLGSDKNTFHAPSTV